MELKAMVQLDQQESQPASRLLWAAATQIFGDVQDGITKKFEGQPVNHVPVHILTVLANGNEYELDSCRCIEEEERIWEVRLRKALPKIAVSPRMLHKAKAEFWGICQYTGNIQADHRPEVFAAEAETMGVACDWWEDNHTRYINGLEFKLVAELNTASLMAWYKKRQQTYRSREFPTRGDGWQLV